MDFRDERNKVGVDDMVMLDQINESALLENLKKRYKEGHIYTSIGSVLISINPYKDINVFSKQNIEKYDGKQPFEVPPHVFSLSEETYRSMITENENQCIIISGESGSGKTEASKGIMQYIAAVSGSGERVDNIKNIILESNPLLESFGNAKTLRNNNSSRFGKYIEIQFDYKGDPEGGKITNYLLEKSRVVHQIKGERSFHIFYQMLAASSQEKDKWRLTKCEDFHYLNQSGTTKADGIDDKESFGHTKHAMDIVGISSEERDQIFSVLAGILHLGNITFKPKKDSSEVADKSVLSLAASLLRIPPENLEKALCFRTIESGSARTSTYQVPQNVEQALYSRDALAKGIYGRLFDWLVSRVNTQIHIEKPGKSIGILDIYGFEIFQVNSFEQLCINYTNETLHQIFIDLTLKAEQEEYVREGIKWEPVDYINNKPTVDLIEGKPMGILSLLDEECLFPEGKDKTWLDKMAKNFERNPNFKKTGDDEFSINHYAGNVPYKIQGFLDKNRDTLFHDLIQICLDSGLPILSEIFQQNVPTVTRGGKKRPVTAGFQFKNSVQALLKTLYSCQPHYIRCIKPNEEKKALHFDMEKVKEQSRYLGLLENLRVRRAGYCYRQTFERWMQRYYPCSKQTFPKWNGEQRGGVEVLVKEFSLQQGEYQFGKTKIFIREPKTLWDIEEKRLAALHRIATEIQKTYRAWKVRKEYIERKKEAQDLFRGKKERNRDSLARGTAGYFGDFLGLKHNNEAKHIIGPTGDKEIVFSDIVQKTNKRGKIQDRALIVTEKAIYNCKKLPKPKNGSTLQLQRRIPFDKIASLSLSKFADNYFVVHIPSEYDYVFQSRKKTVLVTLLNNAFKKVNNKPLDLNFAESISVKLKNNSTKVIEFSKDENAYTAQTKKAGKKIQVSVASGVTEQERTRHHDQTFDHLFSASLTNKQTIT